MLILATCVTSGQIYYLLTNKLFIYFFKTNLLLSRLIILLTQIRAIMDNCLSNTIYYLLTNLLFF